MDNLGLVIDITDETCCIEIYNYLHIFTSVSVVTLRIDSPIHFIHDYFDI